MRTVVLLCTYNEAANLPRMFELLAEHLPAADVLVVDDNSPDATADLVRRQANFASQAIRNGAPVICLLSRSGKHGLGSATREGLEWCLDGGYDFIVNMDADLSHDPASAPRLLAACADPHLKVDVAIGSRYVEGGDFDAPGWNRRLLSRVLNGYATRLLGLPVKDCSGSYRCYRAAALRELELDRLTCPGYGFLEELLVALYRNGAELTEVPIQFHPRAGGKSKLGLRDALGAIRVIHQLALCRQKRKSKIISRA